jgi:hypothetical protein
MLNKSEEDNKFPKTPVSLGRAYEPKKENRFLVSFPKEFNIQQWVVAGCDRPSIDIIENLDEDSGITSIGDYIINPITVTFHDPTYPSTTESLMEIFRSLYERDNIELYDLLLNGFDFIIELINPTGAVVERWLLTGCKISNIDFGTLNISSDGGVRCYITIKPKHFELLNIINN